MKARQQNLPGFTLRTKHGHGILQGRRKEARPLSPKLPLHVTFRSAKARGELSFLHPRNARRVSAKARELAKRFQVRIHQYANSGNHLHLLIEGKTRKGLQDFLRAMGARIAGIVTGAKKGSPFGKFWDGLVFSRVVTRGRDFANTQWYVLKNHLEAEGLVDHDRSRRRNPAAGRSQHPPPVPKAWRGMPDE
jgi:REP element-mobilizing transposase RayT